METWRAFHSQDGPDGSRNALGQVLFPSNVATRSTRSEAAGVVSPHLPYAANTLVDNGIAMWNKFPALREASTKRMASNPGARHFKARNEWKSIVRYTTKGFKCRELTGQQGNKYQTGHREKIKRKSTGATGDLVKEANLSHESMNGRTLRRRSPKPQAPSACFGRISTSKKSSINPKMTLTAVAASPVVPKTNVSDKVVIKKASTKVSAKAPKSAKVVAKVTPAHPPYGRMVLEALHSIKDRKGSSRQALLKYIMSNYEVGKDQKPVNNHLKKALVAAAKKGSIKNVGQGKGAAGSFKLSEKAMQMQANAAEQQADQEPAPQPSRKRPQSGSDAAPAVKRAKKSSAAKTPTKAAVKAKPQVKAAQPSTLVPEVNGAQATPKKRWGKRQEQAQTKNNNQEKPSQDKPKLQARRKVAQKEAQEVQAQEAPVTVQETPAPAQKAHAAKPQVPAPVQKAQKKSEDAPEAAQPTRRGQKSANSRQSQKSPQSQEESSPQPQRASRPGRSNPKSKQSEDQVQKAKPAPAQKARQARQRLQTHVDSAPAIQISQPAEQGEARPQTPNMGAPKGLFGRQVVSGAALQSQAMKVIRRSRWDQKADEAQNQENQGPVFGPEPKPDGYVESQASPKPQAPSACFGRISTSKKSSINPKMTLTAVAASPVVPKTNVSDKVVIKKASTKVSAKAPKSAKVVAKVTPAHPPYGRMVLEALHSIKDRKGSSRQALLKYIMSNYEVGKDQKPVNNHLKKALVAAAKKGSIKNVGQGKGAAGSFKLSEKAMQMQANAAEQQADQEPAPQPSRKRPQSGSDAAPAVKRAKKSSAAKTPTKAAVKAKPQVKAAQPSTLVPEVNGAQATPKKRWGKRQEQAQTKNNNQEKPSQDKPKLQARRKVAQKEAQEVQAQEAPVTVQETPAPAQKAHAAKPQVPAPVQKAQKKSEDAPEAAQPTRRGQKSANSRQSQKSPQSQEESSPQPQRASRPGRSNPKSKQSEDQVQKAKPAPAQKARQARQRLQTHVDSAPAIQISQPAEQGEARPQTPNMGAPKGLFGRQVVSGAALQSQAMKVIRRSRWDQKADEAQNQENQGPVFGPEPKPDGYVESQA
eukprot:maker-scaffold9_size846264-snap-gene-2.18 protein:Tk08387 transcript:maker-scaffold9_size846264-snap-gene-2.18-mRNA-1 annotation:"histone 1o"